MKCLLLIVALAVAARAQVPSLGFCPEYIPMPGFEMERFAGVWYEAERYFQLTEVASRCVNSNYTKTSSGKYIVTNEVISRFTGLTRVLKGEIRPALKGEEGKLNVKYSTVPIPIETQYNVLETDYDTYAVLWSCTGVGPVHTQNAWIMTRQRLAPGDVMQKAYAVLDKHKISKMFFVKTNQDDCAFLEENQATTSTPVKKVTTPEPPKKSEESAVVDESYYETEESPEPLPGKSAGAIRQPIVPDAPEVIIQTRKAEIEAKEKAAAALKPVKAAAIQQPIVESLQADEAVRSVPEVIMKIADQAKPIQQEAEIPVLKSAIELNKESPIPEEIKEIKKESPIPDVMVEMSKPEQPLAEEPVAILLSEPSIRAPIMEAAPLNEEAVVAAVAPVVSEPEVQVPDVEVVKKPEPIVEEKIEIVAP